MTLFDLQNEQALDFLADSIDPALEILSDDEVKRIYNSEPKLNLVKYIIKSHKKSVIEIMARMHGKEPADYTFTIVDLVQDLLGLIENPTVAELFTWQAQKTE